MDRADLEQWKGREVARLLALVETERRYYQEIVAAVPVGLAVVSPDRDIVSANRAFRQAFGLRTEELRRRTLDQLIPATELQRSIADALSAGAPQPSLLIELKTESGQTRLLRTAVVPIRNWDDETQLEVLLMVEDLTEIERLHGGRFSISVDAEVEKLPAAVEPVPVTVTVEPTPEPVEPVAAPSISIADPLAVIWSADSATLAFTYVEGAVEETLGYPASHWIEDPEFFGQRIHPDDRDDVLRFYRSALERDGSAACEFRALASDGRLVWCSREFPLGGWPRDRRAHRNLRAPAGRGAAHPG